MNRRFFASALAGLLIAACARPPDTRIADFTRDYVAGRISQRRYHDLCHAVSAERHPGGILAKAFHSQRHTNDTDDKKPTPPPPQPPPTPK